MHNESNIIPILERLTAVVQKMKAKLEAMTSRQDVKIFYTTAEFAEKTGLKEKTVRDYCCEGKIRGEKQRGGHGRAKRWVIAHEEYLRYQREGSHEAA
jgi:hypothetical protein